MKEIKAIKKILIANRGEIALRVIRSAKEMGITTVAVYSEADRHSLHVRYADEAYLIGPPPSSQSYLNQEKIIQTALDCSADAIHPGYGFLSENAGFASKVTEAGLLFIGPSPQSIEIMGNKLAAKQAALKFGIPMVPGTEKAITDVKLAKELAEKIGYPILIKASAGGGGKGMRIVQSEVEFENQMQRAISEAISSFGDGAVFIEKYVTSPRHIEVQVLGDQHGNIVHLFERECSIQRRHQKVIEEAPSSILTPKLREEIGAAAIKAAKSCDYFNAGTVEFIMDDQLKFYFLEMNTRLQVEHPVTEMVTDVDLVKEQIKIAEGRTLSFTQEQLEIRGHSIELRVYAEDPKNNFLPDIGTLKIYNRPQGNGIRVDDGFEQGMEIPIYYDPMIAKLVVFAENRTEAIAKMIRAIDEYTIVGVENTLAFGKYVMQHEAFISGNFNTHFVDKHFKPELMDSGVENQEDLEVLGAVLAAKALTKMNNQANSSNASLPHGNKSESSAWKNRKQMSS